MGIMIKLRASALEVGFEVGSVDEAIFQLTEAKDKFRQLLEIGVDIGSSDDSGNSDSVVDVTAAAGVAPVAEAPAKRGRGKGKTTAEAVAPAPIAVPGAAPTPPAPAAPADTALGDNGIPKFLDRTAPAAAAAPPPPPLMPSAPPVAPPAATPQFILGNKIADDLQKRLDGSADKGAALQTWLMPHVTAITVPTATIDEVIAVMRFTADDKVAHLATPLGIS